MDEKNIDNQQSIDEILKEFQSQREKKESSTELEPPKHYRENTADLEETQAEASEKNGEISDTTKKNVKGRILKRKKASKEPKPRKERKKLKINFKRLLKILILFIVIAAVAIAAVFGIRYSITASKTAYLKPYEKKYPDVEFPVGIMEKYCDIYGENPSVVGYINITENHLSSPVLSSDDGTHPYAEANDEDCEQFNYVVYLTNDSLEKYYSSAEAYNNSATGYISYSDLFNEYRFKVIGAFYTNIDPADDNGYIFPYNVTEQLTNSGYSDYFDRLNSRFLYDVGITLTRQDKLLTISCPTSYRESFRFVVVGVLRNELTEKATASEKSKVHYPQVIYDENGQENPYALSYQWYPEIVIKSDNGKEKTKKQTIEDYKIY